MHLEQRTSALHANSLRRGVEASDGVIHTAYNHDFMNVTREAAAEADTRVIEVLGAALEGSSRPLVITSASGARLTAACSRKPMCQSPVQARLEWLRNERR